MRPLSFIVAFVAASLCLVSCSMFTQPLEPEQGSMSGSSNGSGSGSGDGSSDGSGSGSSGGSVSTPCASDAGYLSATYTYVALRDSVRVYTDQNYCYGDSLVEDVTVSVAYELRGDTLWLTGVSATGPLQEELLLDGDDAVLLVRDGHAFGLNGTWVLVAAGDRYGTMHAPSKSLGTQVVEFDAASGEIQVRVSKPKTDIEYAIAVALIDLDPNISVNVISDFEVRARGHVTNETITLKRHDWDSLTYTSNDSDHEKHTFRANPVECPNEPAPQWFYDFVKDNSGLVKRKR